MMSASTFRSHMRREARDLYVGRRMSCRAVSDLLREKYDRAPSHATVYEWMKFDGVLRTRSESDRIMNERIQGVDYGQKERQALDLWRKDWSIRRIADEIGVSRRAVTGWFRKRGLHIRTPSEATLHAAWDASTEAAERRRHRVREVFRLRFREEMKVRDIALELGVSISTVYNDLKSGFGLNGRSYEPGRKAA